MSFTFITEGWAVGENSLEAHRCKINLYIKKKPYYKSWSNVLN